MTFFKGGDHGPVYLQGGALFIGLGNSPPVAAVAVVSPAAAEPPAGKKNRAVRPTVVQKPKPRPCYRSF
ncbi:MAG: hypothetical protein EXR99_06425 [Gemmataceae bacterium]|nr:hypothetical protein [Gemmataceae bacterium]